MRGGNELAAVAKDLSETVTDPDIQATEVSGYQLPGTLYVCCVALFPVPRTGGGQGEGLGMGLHLVRTVHT